MHFAKHPIDLLKEFPNPAPCDTVTVSPAAGMDMSLLRVWNDEGQVEMEVHLPTRHATPAAQARMLAFVRGWRSSSAPLSISPGPQLVPR